MNVTWPSKRVLRGHLTFSVLFFVLMTLRLYGAAVLLSMFALGWAARYWILLRDERLGRN